MLSTEFLRFQALKNSPLVKIEREDELWAGSPGWSREHRARVAGRIKQPNHELLALWKVALLTRELGQDDFGKPRVVLAAQTFPFLLCSLLIIGWELLFTFHGEAIPVRCFSEGFRLRFAKHTQFQMQLCQD